MRVPLVLSLPLALLLTFAPPAASEDGVTVTLRYGFVHDAAAARSCTVEVAPGADAFAVLDAAVRTLCVMQYAHAGTSGATRLTCLNGVCETHGAALNWAQFHDGELAPRNLYAFSAAEGAVLGFAYGPIPA